MIINLEKYDLVKGSDWREHLHPRGADGKFAAIRGGSKVVAKNGTEGKVAKVTDTHYHIEKPDGKVAKVLKGNVMHAKDHAELAKKSKKKKAAPKAAKGEKTNAKTGTKSAKKTDAGAKPKPATGRKPAGKPASTGTADKPKTAKKASKAKVAAPKATPKTAEGKKARVATPKKPATKSTTKAKPAKGAATAVSGAKKAPAKGKATGIRSTAQKNRKLAYDAGDKVGGARKDLYEANFKDNPTLKTLAELERDNPAVAQKLAVKKFLLPPVDFEAERKAGADLPTALMKKAIFDRVAAKPINHSPEARLSYVESINKLQRHFAGIKDFDKMAAAIREFAELGYATGRGYDQAKRTLAGADNSERMGGYVNRDYFQRAVDKGDKAKGIMDFTPLGERLEGFFTTHSSRDSSLKTVRKNAAGGWEGYFGEKEKKKAAPKKSENAKWERKAAAEHLRTGGRKTKVEKPEDLIKQFGVRGVEFGHWVNDASGKYHLQRSAEAFSDMADVLGIDDKDISLNKRLAIAFGARGKGGALAHYEPSRKVINMTKHGGAGSLAHEWGHALDNIMHQYASNGKESLNMASDGLNIGYFPQLEALYNHTMDTITAPTPGMTKKVEVDSADTANRQANYYPRMRDAIRKNPGEQGIKEAMDFGQELLSKWTTEARALERLVQQEEIPYIQKSHAKRLRQRQIEIRNMEKNLPHLIAQDVASVTGKPFKGTLELPRSTSEFHDRMKSMDGDRKKYYQQPVEMFARVFEAYIEDKLAKGKRSNNYLVHGTSEGEVKAMGAPFPIGAERKAMFKAMENLMGHISGGALKKALEMERLGKSFNEANHRRDGAGRFAKLQAVADRSENGVDMYMNAQEEPEAMQELKEGIKGREGGTRSKLNELFDELFAGKVRDMPDYNPPNRKPIHAMDMSAPAHSADSLTVTLDPAKDNHASAPFGVGITIGASLLQEPPETQAHILAHEVGHVISNLHDGLARHILDNPHDALGRLNLKESRFEGVFGTHTPEESFAEAYAVYHNNPLELMERYPLAHSFVETVTQLLPHHINYLTRARAALQELN